MGMRSWSGAAVIAVVVAGLTVPSGLVWAQALEVGDPAEMSREVTERVGQLISELSARDPELAQEIERQQELCLRDLNDGRLDHEGFTHDIEQFREVREMMERAMGTEAGSESTRQPFEQGDRPEMFQPTPEMMERMQGEMDRWLAEHPEMAEYAQAEFEHFGQEHFGPEMGEHFGPEMGEHPMPESMEQAREMFDRWMGEGHTAEEMERAQEMFHEYEREYEQYREMFERDYANVLDQHIEGQPLPPGSGETLVRTENHFVDHNGDQVIDQHVHEIYRHSDNTCHDHGANVPAGC